MKKITIGWLVALAIFVSVFGAVFVSALRFDGSFMEASTNPPIAETEIVVETEPELIDPSEWFATDIQPIETTEEIIEVTKPTEPPFLLDEAFEAEWGESAVYMAKTIWGEARGVSEAEQEKVAWCVLNRVDDSRFPNTIIGVITAPNQFHGYSSGFPCTDEMYELALDVIYRWQLEKCGGESNRNLDPDYLYFCSDGTGLGNIFRKSW